MRKRTKEFKRFRAAVLRYVDAFGLTDWEVQVQSEDAGAERASTAASVCIDGVSRTALVLWNKTSTYKLDPDKAARHEVLHILLHEMLLVAAGVQDPYHDCVTSAEHSCIRRLEKYLDE